MGMINSQGFKDGYEDNDFKYDVIETDKKYSDQYYEGRNWRNIHLSIFELQKNCIDVSIESFQANHNIAVNLMNDFTFL